MGSLIIEHQLNDIISYGLLNQIFFLRRADQRNKSLNCMCTLLITSNFYQSRWNDFQNMNSLWWDTILTQTTKQVIRIWINHQIWDLVLDLLNHHIQIRLRTSREKLLNASTSLLSFNKYLNISPNLINIIDVLNELFINSCGNIIRWLLNHRILI